MKPIYLVAVFWLLFAPFAKAQLTKVVSLPDSVPPGNIAISQDGRVFYSVHEFYGKPLKVVELKKDGTQVPYPNIAWASAPEDGPEGLNGVLGLNVSRRGILWLLDGTTPTRNARLIGWDINQESLHRIIYLGFPVTHKQSFVNDLAIDDTHNAIYITDVATPQTSALIVVDLNTGQARRVLEGSQYTRPENIDMVIEDRIVTLGGQPARIGANPITISPDNQWLYFGAMNGLSIYRVKTEDLLNAKLAGEQLTQRVQRYGDKPISDGITIDNNGHVYVTSITDNSVGVTKPDGSYQTLYQSDTLSWADGFAVGPDNQIYVTVNELHHSPVLNNGKNTTTGKFAIYRFNALAQATTGR